MIKYYIKEGENMKKSTLYHQETQKNSLISNNMLLFYINSSTEYCIYIKDNNRLLRSLQITLGRSWSSTINNRELNIDSRRSRFNLIIFSHFALYAILY